MMGLLRRKMNTECGAYWEISARGADYRWIMERQRTRMKWNPKRGRAIRCSSQKAFIFYEAGDVGRSSTQRKRRREKADRFPIAVRPHRRLVVLQTVRCRIRAGYRVRERRRAESIGSKKACRTSRIGRQLRQPGRLCECK